MIEKKSEKSKNSTVATENSTPIENLELKKWPISPMLKNGELFAMLVIGSRRSGKSNFIKHLFKECKFKKHYDHILIFCNSDEVKDFYSEFVPGKLFFKEFNEDIFTNIFKQSAEYRKNGNPKKYLVVFDDSIGFSQKNDEGILNTYCNGRHHNVSIIFCSQRLFLTNTSARTNSDIVLIGRSKSSNEKQYIIDEFMRGSLNQDEIPKGLRPTTIYFYLIRKHTVNYGFLIVDTTKDDSNGFFDTIYQYQPPNMKKIKFK